MQNFGQMPVNEFNTRGYQHICKLNLCTLWPLLCTLMSLSYQDGTQKDFYFQILIFLCENRIE